MSATTKSFLLGTSPTMNETNHYEIQLPPEGQAMDYFRARLGGYEAVGATGSSLLLFFEGQSRFEGEFYVRFLHWKFKLCARGRLFALSFLCGYYRCLRENDGLARDS